MRALPHWHFLECTCVLCVCACVCHPACALSICSRVCVCVQPCSHVRVWLLTTTGRQFRYVRVRLLACACVAVGMCVCGCWHVCVCGCWHVRVWLLACACGCWHVRVWLLTFSGRQFRYVVPLTLHDLLEEINEMQMPKTVQVCSAADSIT